MHVKNTIMYVSFYEKAVMVVGCGISLIKSNSLPWLPHASNGFLQSHFVIIINEENAPMCRNFSNYIIL